MREPKNQFRGTSRTAAWLVGLVGASLVALWGGASLYAGSASPADVVVQPGQVVTVAGTSIRCNARRRNGVLGFECQSAPRARGVLGARVARRSVAAYEFVDSASARTLFSARRQPGGALKVCRR